MPRLARVVMQNKMQMIGDNEIHGVPRVGQTAGFYALGVNSK